jgi:hypothetical protein
MEALVRVMYLSASPLVSPHLVYDPTKCDVSQKAVCAGSKILMSFKPCSSAKP